MRHWWPSPVGRAMMRWMTPERWSVFVLMPFGKRWSNVYELVLRRIEDRLPVRVSRADNLPFDMNALYDKTISAIASADLVIADLSGLNPNVFYELGYAHALGKIVLPISSDELPFDVRGFFTIRYDPEDLHGLAEQLETRVTEAIEYGQRKKPRASDRVLERHPEETGLIQKYALSKATNSGWKRPRSYFSQAEVVQATGIEPDLAYPILDSLRNVGRLVCVNWKGSPLWSAPDDLKQTTHSTDGRRVVAQKAAYKFLARAGIVSKETLSKARDRALEALTREFPGLIETASSPSANLLDEALSAAIDELRRSSRSIRFDETSE